MTSARGEAVTGPLHGIRVLDFSAMIAGPYCGRLLADLGAEVIKLEPPEGDFMRARRPLREGASLYFGALNAGKRSIALDLKRAEAVSLVRELAAKADVLLENFRPGVMRRLGLDFAALSAANPRLVYCSISGYGQAGKAAGLPAYAPVVQAASGFDTAGMAYAGVERPLKSAIFVPDYLTGVHAFGAICAALVRRAATGRGESIDCALMDAMLGMLAFEVGAAQEPVTVPRPMYQAIRARDGFLMVAPISPANFADLVRVPGCAHFAFDARFATPDARSQNWDALMAELEGWASERSAADCEALLAEHGVPVSRYQSVADVLASPYAAERGLFARVAHGGAEFLTANPPFKMEGAGAGAAVPGLGEHGAELLERLLGRTAEEIARLKEQGVLVTAPP